jgi:uncharacterized protein YjiS (DUF1127 family)
LQATRSCFYWWAPSLIDQREDAPNTEHPDVDVTSPSLRPQRVFRQVTMALQMIATWMMRNAQRRALRELSQEGRLLADIGLTREQALREASKPFWQR